MGESERMGAPVLAGAAPGAEWRGYRQVGMKRKERCVPMSGSGQWDGS